ncbi:YdjC-like protein [Thermus arciformis]|uniref:YdjC-like protein n=1 Tax=Thermus arciformis TaxID=482827 RepID=A0A1G7GZ48_9DEIN|nr:polysaccharide deacetylase family protein [Thermus arciformis]SDE93407.1 YdjC-like protein [Thermus arciformis]
MDLLERLGLGGRRVLILHHDDLGLTHAQNAAYQALGFPTGSVMVPGAWASGVRGKDLGVHLVLTSEWPAPRMRPLTGGESLRDEAGYFPSSLEVLWRRARSEEVERELRAQIEAARRLFSPTHLDTHQGAVLRPDLAKVYLRLAREYRLPALVPESLEDLGVPPAFLPDLLRLMEEAPFPRVRFLDPYGLPPEGRLGFYLDLSRLGPGLYYLVHHSALPTPEGRALPDWPTREADYFALSHPEVRRVLAEFHPLTWRQVKEAL